MDFFDAHLDLAYLGLAGRDLLADDPASGDDPLQPGAITLPSLRAGRVRTILATIFTEPGGDDRSGHFDAKASYDPEDPLSAYHAGVEQLNLYHRLARDGHVAIPTGGCPQDAPISIGVLIENADPIPSPDDLEWWVERGVVAIGMAWAAPGRYAAGNACPAERDSGLTDLGRALATRMDELGVVHDASHLSDRALGDLFDATDQRIVATHSNCRSLVTPDRPDEGWEQWGRQRQLTDESIREIASRDGVIGLNLFKVFLTPDRDRTTRPPIARAIDHVVHICDLLGSRDHVGLGSDADGGLTATDLPDGIDIPKDYTKLLDELAARGFSDADIAAFAHGNWARIFPELW